MKEFRLDNEKIKSGFKAPDAYFEKLHEEIFYRIETPEPKEVSIWNNTSIRMLVAAVVIVAFGILATFNFSKAEVQPSASEIASYIAYSRISDYEIISLLDESDILEMQSEVALDEGVLEETLSNNPNIEQYILLQ